MGRKWGRVLAAGCAALIASAAMAETDNMKVDTRLTLVSHDSAARFVVPEFQVDDGGMLMIGIDVNPDGTRGDRRFWSWSGGTAASSIAKVLDAKLITALVKYNNAIYSLAKLTDGGDHQVVKADWNGSSFVTEVKNLSLADGFKLIGEKSAYHPALRAYNGKLYAWGEKPGKRRLLSWDGSASSWQEVQTWDTDSTPIFLADILFLTSGTGTNFYFSFEGGGSLDRLHVFNGSTSTKIDSAVEPRYMATINEWSYFSAVSGTSRGLWRTNGTVAADVGLSLGGMDLKAIHMVSFKNRLFLPIRSQNEQGAVKYQLWVGHLGGEGYVKGDTIRMLLDGAEQQLEELDFLDVRAGSQLFRAKQGGSFSLWTTDGTDYGTVKIPGADGNLTTAGILGNQILVDDLGDGSHTVLKTKFGVSSTIDEPTNIKWVGLRASNYGIQTRTGNPEEMDVSGLKFGAFPGDIGAPYKTSGSDANAYAFPSADKWESGVKAISSNFFASDPAPTVVWIVTRPLLYETMAQKGGAFVQCAKPTDLGSGYTGFRDKIYFSDDAALDAKFTGDVALSEFTNRHQAYLDHFDRTGVRVWIQVEPGFGPMEDSGDKRGLLYAIYKGFQIERHRSVIGIGVDAEWYEDCREDDGETGTLAGKETMVQGWWNTIKAMKNGAGENLTMFLKHYTTDRLPNYATLAGLINADIQKIHWVADPQGVRKDWTNLANPDPESYANDPAGAFDGSGEYSLKNQYKTFVDACKTSTYKSPVGFQILYPNDWAPPKMKDANGNMVFGKYGFLNFADLDEAGEEWKDDPAGWDSVPADQRYKLIRKLGISISRWFPDREVGLYVVDFRARMLFPGDKGLYDWAPAYSHGSAGNLVSNGGFSSGLSGWSFYQAGGASASGSVSGGAFLASVVDGGTEMWHAHLRQDGIPLAKGKKYLLTFDARAVEHDRAIFSMLEQNGGDYATYSGRKSFYLTKTTQSFSHVFTMGHDSDSAASLCFEFGVEPIDVVIDNVKLVEVTDEVVIPPANWAPGVSYKHGDVVIYGGEQYRCVYYAGEVSTVGREPNKTYMWAVWQKL